MKNWQGNLILLLYFFCIPAYLYAHDEDITLNSLYSEIILMLNEASSKEERFYILDQAAIKSFDVGKVEDAEAYAKESIELASQYQTNWNYGNAIHHSNIVLGRIALRNGDMEEAKVHLLKAGKVPSTPQLSSFGPNMALAKDLLEKGESDTVIEYLEQCSAFWEIDRDKLEFWIFKIKKGDIPQFGANVYY